MLGHLNDRALQRHEIPVFKEYLMMLKKKTVREEEKHKTRQ